ncbi:MAG: DUF177 domain-containing protein [Coriobacteriaceae bacterium]|jgi:uncharacterized protein|nr:DUF177 domain-containing protein [Coriobacteriaceae bacterium]
MMAPTRITIPPELFAPAESSSFEGGYDLSMLKAGPDLYEFASPLTWSLTISNTGDALLLAGTVEGVAKATCARCLETFEPSVSGEIEGYYLLSEESSAPEAMDADEFDRLPPDKVIDLAPLLDAALLLELPLVPLCDEDCKGLCPTCGQNRNTDPCPCVPAPELPDTAPNPFKALEGFPFD